MPRYRIYTNNDLDPSITIERSYPAFKIVDVDDAKAAELAQSYPVQQLAEPPAPEIEESFSSLASANDERRGRRDVTVHLKYPADRETVDLIENAGAAVMDSGGNATLVVAIPNKKVLAALERIDQVITVTPHRLDIEIDPTFFEQLSTSSSVESASAETESIETESVEGEAEADSPAPTTTGILLINYFTKEDAERGLRKLKREKIRKVRFITETQLLVDLVGSEDIMKNAMSIFKCVGIKSISEKTFDKFFNDRARQVIGRGVVSDTNFDNRLTGAGEIVAVADSGLDTGDADTLHPDFRGRIVDIESWEIAESWRRHVTNPGADNGPGDNSGHGTHVAGSVLGNGSRAEELGLAPIKGMAPGAQLLFQAVEQKAHWTQQYIRDYVSWWRRRPRVFGLYGLPDKLSDLFMSAKQKGARIHNNSWGSDDKGRYGISSEQTDEFVWQNKDFLVIVAAGNDGADSKLPHGSIDLKSVGSPGTAKNCLTVGASENVRDDDPQFRVTNFRPAGSDDIINNRFSHPEIRDDLVADNIDDIAAFSSRGPTEKGQVTQKGRRKPDVVAPGTFVLSTRSSIQPHSDQPLARRRRFAPAVNDYMFNSGTSMAAPLVAGAATLWRQYLRTHRGISEPSAALLKAGIIHSAQYFEYRFARPESGPHADNEQGWGRVSLSHVIDLDNPDKLFVHDEANGLETGHSRILKLSLSAVGKLRITLVYSDRPGPELINDLNLMVHDPNGNVSWGNDFAKTGTRDNVNNVEGVIETNAAPGEWKIEVHAAQVALGIRDRIDTQDFALVITADSDFSVTTQSIVSRAG